MGVEENSNKNMGASSKLFSRAFWITIFIMFSLTAGLYLSIDDDGQPAATTIQTSSSDDTRSHPYEIQSPALQRIFARAATETVSSINRGSLIDEGVDVLYAPVYASIDSYLNRHYTVWGSYAELVAAGQGRLSDKIEGELLQGYEEERVKLLQRIDSDFNIEFQKAVDQGVDQELPSSVSRNDLSELTLTLIEDTKARIQVSAPLSGLIAIPGALATKVISQKIAAQLFAALAVKTGVKVVTKGGLSVLGGFLAGAAGGSVVGPVGTIVGGAGGAIATWLAVDKVFVEVDEYLNRENFKAELVAMIDESKENTKIELRAVVEKKGVQIQQFTLRELMVR